MLRTAFKFVLISVGLLSSFTAGAVSAQPALLVDSQFSKELKLPIYVWSKTEEEKNYTAIVVAFHAFLLNGKRFNSIGSQLADRNMLVLSMDARGFGQWMLRGAKRGGSSVDFQQSLKDATLVLRKLRNDYPTVPIVCMGESMGASSAIMLAVDSPELVDGLILSSPCAIKENILISKRALLDGLRLAIAPCCQINLWPYLSQYGAEDDLGTIENLRSDPLVRSRMGVVDILKTMRILESSLLKTRELRATIPVFVIQGSRDRLCKLNKIKSAVGKIPGDQKEFMTVEQGGHLFLEREELDPTIVEKVESWVGRIVTKATTERQNQDWQFERPVAFQSGAIENGAIENFAVQENLLNINKRPGINGSRWSL